MARAAYWLGRSAAALGDPAPATEWYQRAAEHHIAYYGQLAAEELGSAYRPAPPPPAADAGLRARFESKELVRVARMLIEVDADGGAQPVPDPARRPRREPGRGRPGRRARRRERAAVTWSPSSAASPPTTARSTRPRRSRSRISPASSGPPPGEPDAALLLGVARQESVFNPWVSSHAGAQGLLQLIPRTARLMARSLDLPYNEGLLTGDPDYNIRLGSHYLKTLLARYRGETALAVAAYNAGPSRVDEWLQLHGDPRRRRPLRPDRLGRADSVRRDPQLRRAGARGARHVPPPAGREPRSR